MSSPSHSPPSKKRKTRTDYSDTEPTGALHALQAIRNKLKVHGAVDPDDRQAEDAGATINVDDTELAQFDGVIEWMKSKTLTAESYSFSSADPQLQAKLRITEGRHLNLEKNLRSQLDVAKAAGENNFMSSKNMYRFLEMLVNLVAAPASARTRIDAFLYRAAAMLPANKQMVLNVEFKLTPVPAPTVSCSEAVLVGFLDYTIVVTDPQTAVHFLGRPDIHSFVGDIDSILGCFVVEAKDRNVTLGGCIPQVVTQLYAVAKKLKKTHRHMHSGYAGHSDHARLFSRQACTWRQFVLHTVIPAVDAFLHLGCPHQAYHCSSPFLAQTTLSIYPFVPPRIILPIDSLARTASWPLTPSDASPLTFARDSATATPNHKSFTRTACPICQ